MTRHIITLTIVNRSGPELLRDILPAVEAVADWESAHIEEVGIGYSGDVHYRTQIQGQHTEADHE